jgi:glucose/arabinose dehydrogenase
VSVHRPTRRRATAFVALACLLVLVSASGIAHARIRAHRVAGGLHQPVGFTLGPDQRIWYGEKTSGEIRVHNRSSGHSHRFFVVPRVTAQGERGLLGIALHPDFPATPFVYVYATRRVNGSVKNQILRLENDGGRGRHLTVLFSSPAREAFHAGGRILFGPDGMLYAVIGEDGDPRNAQQLGDSRGKILRMTPNGGIPGDNPLGNRRVFSYGHRNSFGFAFDPDTDVIWESENGPECNDEVNRIVPGRNYGWGPHETCAGRSPGNTNRDGPNPVRPKRWYSPPPGLTGVAFCDGCQLGPKSGGRVFMGAVNTGAIRRLRLNANRTDVTAQDVVYDHRHGVISLEADATSGALFFSDFSGIYRLVKR